MFEKKVGVCFEDGELIAQIIFEFYIIFGSAQAEVSDLILCHNFAEAELSAESIDHFDKIFEYHLFLYVFIISLYPVAQFFHV